MDIIKEDFEEGVVKTVDDIVKIFASKVKGPDLVDNYIQFLEKEYPALVRSYQSRLRNQPTSARAEAVTFHFFRYNVNEVRVNETRDEGGTDFLCKTGDSEFIAEITSVKTESVTNKSGLKYDPTAETTVQTISPITQKLCDTVNSKQRQMSEYNYPGILVIASDHPLADTLLDPFDAQRLLVGDMKIGVSISTDAQATQELSPINKTELKYSCFLQVNPGWEVCNRSISAVLLFHISEASAFLVGILHPDPEHTFSPKLLPSIPFIRLRKWPPEGNRLECEWVIYENTELVIPTPKQKRFWYDPDFN